MIGANRNSLIWLLFLLNISYEVREVIFLKRLT